jgi:hypothetical protein
MWYRSCAILIVMASVMSSQARSEELHDKWLKYYNGEWTWKATDGNNGTVKFQLIPGANCLIVTETIPATGWIAVGTTGWQSGKNALGGTGFDSDGSYLETVFTQITEDQATGHRVRTSKGKETKEAWKVTRRSNDEYEIVINMAGKDVTVVATRKK